VSSKSISFRIIPWVKFSVFDRHAKAYDRWFDGNAQTHQAGVNALRRIIPEMGLGVKIGAGTGRFSTPWLQAILKGIL
jgi:hypothetical protein